MNAQPLAPFLARCLALSLVCGLATAKGPLLAQEPELAPADTETPWGERWQERGLEFGGGASIEGLRSTTEDRWLGNLDVGLWLDADLGPLLGLDAWHLFVNPTFVGGDEEGGSTRTRLYQAWLSWSGESNREAQVGLLDLTWHFHSLPSAAPFVRLPTGTGAEFSPGSLGLLDLFPLSAPTVRGEVRTSTPNGESYVQAAFTQLTADHELHGRALFDEATAWQRSLVIVEFGQRHSGTAEAGWRHRHFGIGTWRLPTHPHTWGTYAFADVALSREAALDGQGLSAFLSGSVARADGFEIEERVVVGFSYEGLLPRRDEDVTAFALLVERRGAELNEEKLEEPIRQAWEFTHRYRLTEHLALQGTLQWQYGLNDEDHPTETREGRVGLRLIFEY